MKYVIGNANKGYRVGHSGKKRAHNPKSSSPSSDVVSRKMNEEDWQRFYQNKKKRK